MQAWKIVRYSPKRSLSGVWSAYSVKECSSAMFEKELRTTPAETTKGGGIVECQQKKFCRTYRWCSIGGGNALRERGMVEPRTRRETGGKWEVWVGVNVELNLTKPKPSTTWTPTLTPTCTKKNLPSSAEHIANQDGHRVMSQKQKFVLIVLRVRSQKLFTYFGRKCSQNKKMSFIWKCQQTLN